MFLKKNLCWNENRFLNDDVMPKVHKTKEHSSYLCGELELNAHHKGMKTQSSNAIAEPSAIAEECKKL